MSRSFNGISECPISLLPGDAQGTRAPLAPHKDAPGLPHYGMLGLPTALSCESASTELYTVSLYLSTDSLTDPERELALRKIR